MMEKTNAHEPRPTYADMKIALLGGMLPLSNLQNWTLSFDMFERALPQPLATTEVSIAGFSELFPRKRPCPMRSTASDRSGLQALAREHVDPPPVDGTWRAMTGPTCSASATVWKKRVTGSENLSDIRRACGLQASRT